MNWFRGKPFVFMVLVDEDVLFEMPFKMRLFSNSLHVYTCLTDANGCRNEFSKFLDNAMNLLFFGMVCNGEWCVALDMRKLNQLCSKIKKCKSAMSNRKAYELRAEFLDAFHCSQKAFRNFVREAFFERGIFPYLCRHEKHFSWQVYLSRPRRSESQYFFRGG